VEQCVAGCCSVWQRVAACCSVLQCVAVRGSEGQRVGESKKGGDTPLYENATDREIECVECVCLCVYANSNAN